MLVGLWVAISVLFSSAQGSVSNSDDSRPSTLFDMEACARTTDSLMIGTDSHLNTWALKIKGVKGECYELYPVNVQEDEPLVLLSRGEFVQDFMQKAELEPSDLEYIKDELGKNKAKLEDLQKMEKYTLDGSIVYYLYASSESNAELLVDHPYWTLVRGKQCLALEYSKLLHCVEIDGTRYYVVSRLEWVDKVFVDIYDAEFNRVDFVQVQDSE